MVLKISQDISPSPPADATNISVVNLIACKKISKFFGLFSIFRNFKIEMREMQNECICYIKNLTSIKMCTIIAI